ncbi:hypothetical protein GUF57_00515 [Xanthomonas citri pv. citri]|nr:hypothetical protein [Xanthomonas citri pv. citri]QRD58244.1 hypothetical protein H8Z75_20630 [Xanthomonas citri pv. citri]
MGDNSFLSPAFIILVIGVIAVVLFLVTRAKKAQQEIIAACTAGRAKHICTQALRDSSGCSRVPRYSSQNRSPAGR